MKRYRALVDMTLVFEVDVVAENGEEARGYALGFALQEVGRFDPGMKVRPTGPPPFLQEVNLADGSPIVVEEAVAE